ncbi:amidase signature domain-containing protein [Lipomyces tetrasporus]|uniref:Amidase signature domain-containing protein n=1 Tax=Lipomyces tetrasporus TaxID=54092 RepID=A0AAD7QRV9_9ASCO|nr:amidase signature domain-containing protein [Lipomyces tetrasporus]KAJ8100318.1 amidase signature domain-containing protein [Lipomyces tetrasporus]
MAPPTIGWTISQWRETQVACTQEEAIKRVIDLVAYFDKSDPAWITIATPEQINAQFDTLAQSGTVPKDLPLFGVPFAPKDNIDAATFPTTAACPAYLYEPEKDATIVAILKAAGAIVVGKTNLDQFACSIAQRKDTIGIL